MAEVTITEISKQELKSSLMQGTAQKRRVLVFVRCTSAANTDTLDLSSYVTGVADIEGVLSETLDNAVNGGTANTWSTTTLTFAGHAGSGVWEMAVLCNLT